MAEEIILTTPSQLKTLLVEAISIAFKYHQPQQPAAPVDEVLTIDQAAEFLNLTKQTVYGLVSAGKIPYSKPTGSRLYFSRLGLIEWLKDSRRATISEQAAQYEHSRTTGRTRRSRKVETVVA